MLDWREVQKMRRRCLLSADRKFQGPLVISIFIIQVNCCRTCAVRGLLAMFRTGGVGDQNKTGLKQQ